MVSSSSWFFMSVLNDFSYGRCSQLGQTGYYSFYLVVQEYTTQHTILAKILPPILTIRQLKVYILSLRSVIPNYENFIKLGIVLFFPTFFVYMAPKSLIPNQVLQVADQQYAIVINQMMKKYSQTKICKGFLGVCLT